MTTVGSRLKARNSKHDIKETPLCFSYLLPLTLTRRFFEPGRAVEIEDASDGCAVFFVYVFVPPVKSHAYNNDPSLPSL